MVFILYTIKKVLDSAQIEHYNEGKDSVRIEHHKGGSNMKMTVNERREIYCHSLTAETQMCVNCIHYHQHY